MTIDDLKELLVKKHIELQELECKSRELQEQKNSTENLIFTNTNNKKYLKTQIFEIASMLYANK